MHRESLGDDQPGAAARPRGVVGDKIVGDLGVAAEVGHGGDERQPVAQVQAAG
jgi:hypothetical protein